MDLDELDDIVADMIHEEMAQSADHSWHPDVMAPKVMERFGISEDDAWASINRTLGGEDPDDPLWRWQPYP